MGVRRSRRNPDVITYTLTSRVIDRGHGGGQSRRHDYFTSQRRRHRRPPQLSLSPRPAANGQRFRFSFEVGADVAKAFELSLTQLSALAAGIVVMTRLLPTGPGYLAGRPGDHSVAGERRQPRDRSAAGANKRRGD